ncbi:transcription factor SipA3 [Trichophyton tonsurans CBS 112818]|uniref:Transcription factor SipA3 n=1 Tax=Trichophyton tonsurans (strain CBS 112818) TaxID=647933 RepID=F2RU75_TRIT1|nr:transcription factor SipA3 [Trichophyton tonsurans CBS 112818]
MASHIQLSIPQEGKMVNVVPVVLKEAALDSPSFRATTVHFSEQIDYMERWLDNYIKTTGRLTSELASLENISNGILAHITSPPNISEAILDQDYALLAMKRYGECFRDSWSGMINATKRFEVQVAEPIRAFMQGDIRAFKELRRVLDQTQKQFDQLQARYSSQGKSKEPSSLREDAFQLHEARKAYLKASMDFSVQAPQLKVALEKLLVKVFFDQWREFRVVRDASSATFTKYGQEMERTKGWTHELEAGEKSARRDLLIARKQIEESVEYSTRPSRELDDYSISTVPYLGSHGPASVKLAESHVFLPEKQGWLNLRVITGKPTRTLWVRRWAFLKNGIFGCLVQNPRTGGVEESERIGVLLCSIRPAFQEERRFCFEVKTKSNTILLQGETQKELTDWIGSFEAAKRKALESPSSEMSAASKSKSPDPAFAISQPPAPEFAADPSDSLTPNTTEELPAVERGATTPLLDLDALGVRSSGDFSHSRRSTGPDRDADGTGRDHTSRIIQKLDIHRKQNPTSPLLVPPSPAQPSSGIASLISASHSMFPVTSVPFAKDGNIESGKSRGASKGDRSQNSLAPSTLVNPPAPTSMSRVAIMVSAERGIGMGPDDTASSIPTGMMANLWGSSQWAMVNQLQREEPPGTPANTSNHPVVEITPDTPSSSTGNPQGRTSMTRHRATVSLGDTGTFHPDTVTAPHDYPSYYPQQLRPHNSQFRLLFPHIPRNESLVLVFRATFSPNDQQDFPGRAFATTHNIYFYSNHLGLVLTTCANLRSITEVTAAPGRDCDFLYLHVVPEKGSDIPGRLGVKTFLEPLKLLQRRLNYLVTNAALDNPAGLETVINTLIKLETTCPTRTPSMDSWEDVSLNTPADDGTMVPKPEKLLKASTYIDHNLDIDPIKQNSATQASRIRLPSQPVIYEPQGALNLAAEQYVNMSPKALFLVLFGDNSPIWQLSQHQRRAQNIKQGPWVTLPSSHLRREMAYQIRMVDTFGRSHLADVCDYQIIDVFNDHLCYVVTDKRTPWHLPFKRQFRLVSKAVITHVSKSKCKLAIFTKVEWILQPYLISSIIERQAMKELEQSSLDLIDLVSDQVKRLGPYPTTKSAISMFGNIGHQTETSNITVSERVRLQLQRPLKQSGLLPLLLETSGSLFQSAASSLIIWFWALLRWIWKVSNANKTILLLLVLSLLANGFTHGVIQWMVARTQRGFSTFREENKLTRNDLLLPPSTPAQNKISSNAAYRLQRTRERLGSYRHNLLVGLKVVNSIEKEVLHLEWERWLRRETGRCAMLDIMLKERIQYHDNNDYDGVLGVRKQILSGNQKEIEKWYKEYCSSCQQDQEKVLTDN